MIRTVYQYGSIIILRDENDTNIGTLSIGEGELLGYSSHFILVRFGNMVISWDKDQVTLGSEIFPENYTIKGITQSGFIAETGQLRQIYDPYCNHIGTQSF